MSWLRLRAVAAATPGGEQRRCPEHRPDGEPADHLPPAQLSQITADFCRNCLAKWLQEGASAEGLELSYEAARELVYGEPYASWKEGHLRPASEEQLRRMEEINRRKAESGLQPSQVKVP